jgi:hypothetical protein
VRFGVDLGVRDQCHENARGGGRRYEVVVVLRGRIAGITICLAGDRRTTEPTTRRLTSEDIIDMMTVEKQDGRRESVWRGLCNSKALI